MSKWAHCQGELIWVELRNPGFKMMGGGNVQVSNFKVKREVQVQSRIHRNFFLQDMKTPSYAPDGLTAALYILLWLKPEKHLDYKVSLAFSACTTSSLQTVVI